MNEQEKNEFKDGIISQVNESLTRHYARMDKWEKGVVDNYQKQLPKILEEVLPKSVPPQQPIYKILLLHVFDAAMFGAALAIVLHLMK